MKRREGREVEREDKDNADRRRKEAETEMET